MGLVEPGGAGGRAYPGPGEGKRRRNAMHRILNESFPPELGLKIVCSTPGNLYKNLYKNLYFRICLGGTYGPLYAV